MALVVSCFLKKWNCDFVYIPRVPVGYFRSLDFRSASQHTIQRTKQRPGELEAIHKENFPGALWNSEGNKYLSEKKKGCSWKEETFIIAAIGWDIKVFLFSYKLCWIGSRDYELKF